MQNNNEFAKPTQWAFLDLVERVGARLWPKRFSGATGWLFLAPAIMLVGILVIGLGYMLEYSFHELDMSTYRLKEAYSFQNYYIFADQPVYIKVLLRTLLASVIVTFVTMFLAFPYAYTMVRTTSAVARKFLLVALFLPFFIGQVVRAYGWLIILGKEGMINSALSYIGIAPLDLIYNYPAVIFGLVQYMIPFAVLLLVPAIAAIPEDVEAASESLGAHWTKTFRYVVIPMARPGLIGASVVVFTLTMTDFAMPEILGGGTTDLIASAIYDSFFQLSNPGLGAALSIILVFLGSAIVGTIFWLSGAGTLSVRGNSE